MEFYMIGPAIGIGLLLIIAYLLLEEVINKNKNKE
jgi:hypothetical protein